MVIEDERENFIGVFMSIEEGIRDISFFLFKFFQLCI